MMDGLIPTVSSFDECRDERPPRKVVGEILESGRRAPSPAGLQSKEFIVVENEEKLERLAKISEDHRIEECAMCVAVVVSPERMERNLGEDAAGLSRLEAVAAVQNIRVSAEEHDISSVWLSGFSSKRAKESLQVPKRKEVSDLVAIGYTDNPVENSPSFGMNETVFYDVYNNQYDTLLDGLHLKGLEDTKEVVERKNRSLKRIFRSVSKAVKSLIM